MKFVVELFADEDIDGGNCQNDDDCEDIEHCVVGSRESHRVIFNAQSDEQRKEESDDYCRGNFKAKFKFILFEKGNDDVCYRKHDYGKNERKHRVELVCHDVAVGGIFVKLQKAQQQDESHGITDNKACHHLFDGADGFVAFFICDEVNHHADYRERDSDKQGNSARFVED